jgi:two-component system sensor histidine kinase ChvG
MLATSDRRAARGGGRGASADPTSSGERGATSGARWFGQAAKRTSLTRRIVGLNLIGLGLLVAGVLLLNDFRGKLIELRTASLETQGKIIAIAIAESAATAQGMSALDPDQALGVLLRLSEPVKVRAQIFDRGGRLMRDTALIARHGGGGAIEVLSDDQLEGGQAILAWLGQAMRAMRAMFFSNGPNHDTLGGVAQAQEVFAALGGAVARGERVNERGELIVSVSIPITRLRAVMGVLVLSTQGGDIDAIVESERMSILQVFLVALATSIVLSVLLANAIARPLRRLAAAAEASERGGGGADDDAPMGSGRVEIPDFTQRRDEIGDLSGALKRMTSALYTRIEATEAFAADVAHEIKNPLTSLRSAVETMRLAKDEGAKERLLAVIEHDVARLDRLVTDISNASRLDAELVREARETFDLRALLAQLVEYNQERAAKRGATLIAKLPDAPMPILGIEGQLAQVFVNLIENAVSFSPQGGRIRVSTAWRDAGGVVVRVEDDGPGIPDENLGSVFQRFYSERPDGEGFGDHSGLGLSISRQILHAHGGEIRAENIGPLGAARRGARFVVELPE